MKLSLELIPKDPDKLYCSNCWDNDETLTQHVNGRCDMCGGSNWLTKSQLVVD